MKGTRSGLFAVLACATAVTLSAQTPPAPAEQSQPSSGMQKKDSVTVTGCLERSKDSASPTGTTGAGSTEMKDTTKFTLNNVTPASATGTAGTSGSASTASSYRIDGDDAKLTPHVGHKVEITGTVDSRSAGAGAGSPKLKVDSVKMVAASCTP